MRAGRSAGRGQPAGVSLHRWRKSLDASACTTMPPPPSHGAAVREIRPGLAGARLARFFATLVAVQASLSSASTTAADFAATTALPPPTTDEGRGTGYNESGLTTRWSDGVSEGDDNNTNPFSWWMLLLASGIPALGILASMWVCAAVCQKRIQAQALAQVSVVLSCNACAGVRAHASVMRSCVYVAHACVRAHF